MTDITFRRVDRDEWRIYQDGDILGDVCRLDDILHEGKRYFVVHLSEDVRGPVRVHDRARVREVTRRLVDTHPLW